MKRYLTLLVALVFTLRLTAQDAHFSLYNMSPLSLNPSLTGAYLGTARVGGIYRDQWGFSFLSNQFVTTAFYIDAPLFRGFGKKDWVGVGGMFFSDRAGRLNLSANSFMGSIAYHWSLDPQRRTVLTFALQAGTAGRSIDDLDQRPELFGSNLSQSTFQDNISTMPTGISVNNSNFFDLGAGAMLRTVLGENIRLEAGAALSHILQPEYAVLSAGGTDEGTREQPMTIRAHANVQYPLSETWDLLPSAFFQTTNAGRSETILQVLGAVKINEEKEVSLRFGPGYRFGDSGMILAGVDWKDLRVMASYDIALSDLQNSSRFQSGFEIAAWYILKIEKKPEVTPNIVCPHF